MTDPWYEVVTGYRLEQGDLLPDCPIYRVEAEIENDQSVQVVEERHDALVLTQTCDLENDKVEDVLLASTLPYSELVQREKATNPRIAGTEFRKAAVRGHLVSQTLLSQRLEAPMLPWTLVDFHYLFSVPKVKLRSVANSREQRLRLRSPYKEHVAQAFARYVMRVGLPMDLHDFESFKPPA